MTEGNKIPPEQLGIQKTKQVKLDRRKVTIASNTGDGPIFRNKSHGDPWQKYNQYIEAPEGETKTQKEKRLAKNSSRGWAPRPEELGTTVIFQTGTQKNILGQLTEVVNQLEDGPYHADGRDNVLTFHNSNGSSPVVYEYTYHGGKGDLLNFDIDTDYTISIVEATQTSDIDPDNKVITNEINQLLPQEAPVSVNPNSLEGYGQRGMLSPTEALQAERQQATQEALRNYTPIVDPKQPPPGKQVYSSRAEAIQRESEAYQVSNKEIKEYYDSLEEHFKSRANPGDSGELGDLLMKPKTLPEMIIERTITVQSEVDPVLSSDRARRGEQIGRGNPNVVARHWKDGYKHLESVEGHYVVGKDPNAPWTEYQGYNPKKGEKIVLSRTMVVKIPIPGARIISSYQPRMSSTGSVNDMVRTIQNKITASAQVMGNPGLESSMNIDIFNVSERFSGTWYSKEVNHNISDSGYVCDIEFIEKTKPVSISHIKGTIPTIKVYDALHGLSEVAKKAFENGTHTARADVIARTNELLRLHGKSGKHYYIETDYDNPRKAIMYQAEDDMSNAKAVYEFEVKPKE